MIAIIQCAGSKHHEGRFRTSDGRQVLFVADPAAAPSCPNLLYARPDDPADDGTPWRDKLIEYNRDPGNNPFGLREAGALYKDPVYERLVRRFGGERTFIPFRGLGACQRIVPHTRLRHYLQRREAA